MDEHAEEPLFVDVFVPWRELTLGEITEFENALDEARDESDMQRFLEAHPRMLTQLLAPGRGAWVIPKKRLGSEHETDFLIAQEGSGGLMWHAVELERPQAIVFTRKGDSSVQLNHAIRQIADWREWLSHNRDYASRPRGQSGLGLVDIDPELDGLIIIGRGSEIDQATTARRRRLARDRRIQIETYDWLLSQAKRRHELYDALERERQQTELPRAANEIADWLKMSALSEGEIGGPVRETYFTNIDISESSNTLEWRPFSELTNDIPSKFNEFITAVEQVLAEVNVRLENITYDKTKDYVLLAPSGVIMSAQAERIVKIGDASPVKYFLTALVYTPSSS
jgi:hypothetical protein